MDNTHSTDPYRSSSTITLHHLTYLCFLPPTLISIISLLSRVIPMDTGTAGGIGFLVLIPLALAALVSVPAGLIFAYRFRKDYLLLALCGITILYVAVIVIDVRPVYLYNSISALYGIAGIVILAFWFLYRRKAYYAARDGVV